MYFKGKHVNKIAFQIVILIENVAFAAMQLICIKTKICSVI